MTRLRRALSSNSRPGELDILLIEDDPDDRDLLVSRMQASQPNWHLTTVTTLGEALQSLERLPLPDLILTDLNLPDSEGTETMRRLRAHDPDIPVVVLSGMRDAEIRAICRQENALDFISKQAVLASDRGVELETRIITAMERANAYQMLKQVLDCSPTGMVVTNQEGYILYFNASAAEMFADSPGLRLNYPFGVPLAASNRPTRIQTADTRIIEMRAMEMVWNQEDCHLAVLQDITSHVYRELDLRERSKELQAIIDDQTEHLTLARDAAEAGSRAKSEFLSKVSHELRTPMHTILGIAELLEDKLTEDEDREALASLLGASDTMIGLIDNLLDVAQTETGDFKLQSSTFAPEALLRELVGQMRPRAERAGLSMELALPAELPSRVKGDPQRLRQILSNLIQNALNHTVAGGVYVSLKYRAAGPDRLSLLFSVRDTGSGIAREELPRIFEAFHQVDNTNTRRHGGAGLGLSISKRLAEQMGGHIGVESTPGKGSRFWLQIELPVLDDTDDADEAGFQPMHNDLFQAPEGTLVLLVEDDPANQDICRRMLQRLNCNVVVAGDGRRGLELWQEAEFDLVLMDFNLPQMTGLEATREIRQREAARGLRTRVVGLTADVAETTFLATEDSGMDHMLTKPLGLRDLAAILQDFFSPTPA